MTALDKMSAIIEYARDIHKLSMNNLLQSYLSLEQDTGSYKLSHASGRKQVAKILFKDDDL